MRAIVDTGASDAERIHSRVRTRRDWYIPYCPEIPGANGQGRTKEEARQSLAAAIASILKDRRQEGLRGVPPDADRETVIVK